MNVFLKAGGEKPKRFRIIFPTSLVFNRFTAGIAVKEAEKYGVKITKEQLLHIIKSVKEYKKRHRDWVLVEAVSSEGEEVRVKL
ncbi:MAG: hypothetical protein E7564_03680 [Ruminococcaceae bacterium]|nr:hypothetical protein [Oscillospiraceae bacterium]